MKNRNKIEFKEMCCEEGWKELTQVRKGFGNGSVELDISPIKELLC
jgi:hypothetical protein